jgi:hypothetical protein
MRAKIDPPATAAYSYTRDVLGMSHGPFSG